MIVNLNDYRREISPASDDYLSILIGLVVQEFVDNGHKLNSVNVTWLDNGEFEVQMETTEI